MNLPEGARLVYTVTGETGYARSLPQAERDVIEISAEMRDARGNHTGSLWSFTVYERRDLTPEPCLQMEVFSDAFGALHQVPELFDALGEHAPAEPTTLAELRTLLRRLGAVDVTKREPSARSAREELAELLDVGVPSRYFDHVLDVLAAHPALVARFATEAVYERAPRC